MRILLVADVSNAYYCIDERFNGGRLNYKRLWDFVEMEFGLVFRAVAYGSQIDDQARSFIRSLQITGFETKFKEPKQFGAKRKADWDVGIAMDIVRMIDLVDYVVIVTADGDMQPVVEWVKERGRLCAVIGSGISSDLKYSADRWIEIPESLVDTGVRVREMVEGPLG